MKGKKKKKSMCICQVLCIRPDRYYIEEEPIVKKTHFTKYFEISKREVRIFIFIHSNFEWKHSNLRLRLYLHWSKIMYKMIAKMLWPLMQVNLPLMFYINKIPISSQYYKKRLYDYFFTMTLWSFMKYHSPSLFSVTQHHEKNSYMVNFSIIVSFLVNKWSAIVFALDIFIV